MQWTAMQIVCGEARLTLLVKVYTCILRHEVSALHFGALHLFEPEVELGLHRRTTVRLGTVDGLEHEPLLIGTNGCTMTHMHYTNGITPQHYSAAVE